jgi:hypothetical protein
MRTCLLLGVLLLGACTNNDSAPGLCLTTTTPVGLTEGNCSNGPEHLCLFDRGMPKGEFTPPDFAVGTTIDLPFTLRGPLPAGAYELTATAGVPTGAAQLQVELRYLAQASDGGVAARVLATFNTAPGTPDGGTDDGGAATSDLDTSFTAEAVDAQCGDGLILHLHYVAGPAVLPAFTVELAIP